MSFNSGVSQHGLARARPARRTPLRNLLLVASAGTSAIVAAFFLSVFVAEWSAELKAELFAECCAQREPIGGAHGRALILAVGSAQCRALVYAVGRPVVDSVGSAHGKSVRQPVRQPELAPERRAQRRAQRAPDHAAHADSLDFGAVRPPQRRAYGRALVFAVGRAHRERLWAR